RVQVVEECHPIVLGPHVDTIGECRAFGAHRAEVVAPFDRAAAIARHGWLAAEVVTEDGTGTAELGAWCAAGIEEVLVVDERARLLARVMPNTRREELGRALSLGARTPLDRLQSVGSLARLDVLATAEAGLQQGWVYELTVDGHAIAGHSRRALERVA